MNRVTTAKIDPELARAHWSMSQAQSERAFRSARRHSRWVRWLRVGIPIGVVVGLLAVTLITYFNPARMLQALPVNLDKLVVSGTKITMEKPRLSGFTKDQRPYEFTAEAAAQEPVRERPTGAEHEGPGVRRRAAHGSTSACAAACSASSHTRPMTSSSV